MILANLIRNSCKSEWEISSNSARWRTETDSTQASLSLYKPKSRSSSKMEAWFLEVMITQDCGRAISDSSGRCVGLSSRVLYEDLPSECVSGASGDIKELCMACGDFFPDFISMSDQFPH